MSIAFLNALFYLIILSYREVLFSKPLVYT